MCASKIIALATTLFFVSSSASQAAIITIDYTGTYTGSWSGNYDPTGDPSNQGPPYSGQLPGGSFNLEFVFNTSLALSVNLNSTQVASYEPGPFLNLPSVGYSTGSFAVDGIASASHQVSPGVTTQSLGDWTFGK